MRQARQARGRAVPQRTWRLRAAALVGACVLSACGTQSRNFGYAPTAAQLSELTVGRDTRETVVDAVGSPGSAGVLGGATYLYVAQEVERYGFREPRTLRRNVVALSFDEAGVLRDIEQLGLEDGNVVAYTRAATDAPTEGVGLLRQLGSNLGRIAPTSNTSP